MPTPTTRNGFRKPDPGSDNNTWGANLNAAVFDLVDSAIDGWTTISASGATTLTATQYVANQARQRCLHYTGVTSGTITIPSVEKNYIVWAENADVTITTGSLVNATIKAGDIAGVICDGTDCHKVQFNDFGGQEIVNIAEVPTTNGSAASKAYVDGIAFETTGALPGQNAGTTYRAVFSDGSIAAWRRTHPQSTSTNTGQVLKSTGVDGYPETTSLQWDWDGYQGAQSKTANYTVVRTDRNTKFLLSNTITISLTAAATLGSKFYCRLINVGTGLVTVDPNGSETITMAGQAAKSTIVLIPGEGVDLYCDGTNWTGVVATRSASDLCLWATEATGPSYAVATWTKRLPSNFIINTIGATYSSGNIVGIPPGVYNCSFETYAALTQFVGRIYNETAGTELFHGGIGTSAQFNPDTGTDGTGRGQSTITLTATTTISLQIYGVNTGGSFGSGTGTYPVDYKSSVWLTRISP